MGSAWHPLGRALVLAGLILLGAGLLVRFGPRIPWLGRLPGDIAIHRDGVSFYVPLASCLLASLLLTLLVWFLGRFRPH